MDYELLFDFDEWDDEFDVTESMRVVRVPKRYIRDAANPLEFFDDDQFRRRFRFSKSTIVEHLMPLCTSTTAPNNRGLPIPPIIQVLAALRYYAKSSFQIVCGDLFSISQPTGHRIIKNVSENLCRHIGNIIKMPSTEAEVRRTWSEFYATARFPGIIGLIDGTHIPISSPGGDNAEVFRNRKGYFSINVQLVCGPNEEIFDIVCRWPGSAHDSRVFASSSVRVFLEENYPRVGHLLGDSGYGQTAYLFTPLNNPLTASEKKYNKSHKITRSLVERTIGRWKRLSVLRAPNEAQKYTEDNYCMCNIVQHWN